MDAKGCYFLITSIAFPCLTIGLLIWHVHRHGNNLSAALLGDPDMHHTSGKGVIFLQFIFRLLLLVLLMGLGASTGGIAYGFPYHPLQWPTFDFQLIEGNFFFGFCFILLWFILIPTVLWEILCLFPRSPWWGFTVPFLGHALLSYGMSYAWYTP
jgi:hypothetical protein